MAEASTAEKRPFIVADCETTSERWRARSRGPRSPFISPDQLPLWWRAAAASSGETLYYALLVSTSTGSRAVICAHTMCSRARACPCPPVP